MCKRAFYAGIGRDENKWTGRSSVIRYRILSEYVRSCSRRPLIVFVWRCGPMRWYIFLLFWLIDVQWF